MKKENIRISANEINRFIYCPYQWYYKRTYGIKALTEQYKALGIKTSHHESYYTKGLKHHKQYYITYKIKNILCMLIGLGIGVGIIWMVVKWH